MSGTTVACAIIQQERIFAANVGDTSIIIGTMNPDNEITGNFLSTLHVPSVEAETKRIERLGGQIVISADGMMQVMFKSNTLPKMNITRSLGHFWTEDEQYLISPVPDVHVHHIDPTKDKYIILGTDGLCTMIKPQRTIEIIHSLCKGNVRNMNQAFTITAELISEAFEEW